MAHMEEMVTVLSESVLKSLVSEDEVKLAEQTIRLEMQALERAPPVEPILNELLHATAYRGDNTLGLPRYCPKVNLGKIVRDDIVSFMATYYKPERTVIVGVGIPHDLFVAAVQKAFVPFTLTVSREPAAQKPLDPDSSASQYMGGYLKIHDDLSQYYAPMPELAHVVIGFQSCAQGDPHFLTAGVLRSLLGGGSGEVMPSRLYFNLLKRHPWIYSAEAENFSYSDGGLFCIRGSAQPEHLTELVYMLADEIRNTLEAPILEDELLRAKAQFKSMLLGNQGSCVALLEDIARQILCTGTHQPREYWLEQIDKVTVQDLRALLYRMYYQSAATVLGFGRMEKFPGHQDVLRRLHPTQDIPLSQHLPEMYKQFV